MTKSQIGTHKRPTNVRVNRLFDHKQQIQSRTSANRSGWETIEYVRKGWISIQWGKVKSWFGGLFKSTTIEALDLREKHPRGHGAKWLRQTFHQNLKMVSTRDGRPV